MSTRQSKPKKSALGKGLASLIQTNETVSNKSLKAIQESKKQMAAPKPQQPEFGNPYLVDVSVILSLIHI